MFDEITRFVNWIRRRNPQAHTCKAYLCDLQQFAEIVGDQPPEDISFQDIDQFIHAQSARGLKAATINRRLVAIQSTLGQMNLDIFGTSDSARIL